jgi:hypothetical protein
MNQQRETGITLALLIASTIALGSAAVAAAETGNVQTNSRSANDVYGRASAAHDSAGAPKSLRSASPAASEVLGRGSISPANAGGNVWIQTGEGANVYGRASGGNQFAANTQAAGVQTAALSK